MKEGKNRLVSLPIRKETSEKIKDISLQEGLKMYFLVDKMLESYLKGKK